MPKKQYGVAAHFYAAALTRPDLAEEQARNYRYRTASVSALAASGKGKDAATLDGKERIRLRNQAIYWLEAELVARTHLRDKDPVQTHHELRRWQRDTDLASLREDKELATLSANEQDLFRQFWGRVDRLAKEARSRYTQSEYKGQLEAKEREQSFAVKMTAGKTYTIDMESAKFDTYLRLEDQQGKIVAENDDISAANLNSRIVFAPPRDGTYHVVATSFQQRGIGVYTILVCEFAPNKMDSKRK